MMEEVHFHQEMWQILRFIQLNCDIHGILGVGLGHVLMFLESISYQTKLNGLSSS